MWIRPAPTSGNIRERGDGRRRCQPLASPHFSAPRRLFDVMKHPEDDEAWPGRPAERSLCSVSDPGRSRDGSVPCSRRFFPHALWVWTHLALSWWRISCVFKSQAPRGGEETGLGSRDGKVGQRSQPSAGELLKRPGEMMSWTLSSSPPLCFFSPSLALTVPEKPGSRSGAKPLVKPVMHIREAHTTLMTSLG